MVWRVTSERLMSIHQWRALAAAAHPAQVVTLVISDVPGDDPALIASGPTVADPSTFGDATAVLKEYGITEPRSVIEHLSRAEDETPKLGVVLFSRIHTKTIAAPHSKPRRKSPSRPESLRSSWATRWKARPVMSDV